MLEETNQDTRRQLTAAAPPPQSPMRTLWGAAATVLAVLYTAVLSIFAALSAAAGHPRGVAWIGRHWARMILRTAGIKVEFQGLEKIEPVSSFVLVANHQ